MKTAEEIAKQINKQIIDTLVEETINMPDCYSARLEIIPILINRLDGIKQLLENLQKKD